MNCCEDSGTDSMPGYYKCTRPELVEFILEVSGPTRGRLLDVGCAAGVMGKALRDEGWEVWGVEPNTAVATDAARLLDRVLVGTFPDAIGIEDGAPFDLVVFADSLEHMLDPWGALERAKELLSEHGAVIVSVPNVSHLSVVRGLLRGDWHYSEAGLLDVTHLRFFTPRTIRSTLQDAGFSPCAERAITSTMRRRYSLVRWVLGLAVPHMLVFQQYIAARRLN